MNSFKSDILKVLTPEAVLKIKPSSSSNTHYLDIYENGEKATLKHLKITHIRDTDTCITFDVSKGQKFKTYSPYLRSHKDSEFNKRCDFVIARNEGGVWRVYFGDLKSRDVKVGKIISQLSSSKLFFEYVLKIIELEFGNDKLIKVDYRPRYICIHDNNNVQSGGKIRLATIPGNAEPYTTKCQKTNKQLIVMPVGVLPNGKAKVSFNKFRDI